MKNRTNDTPSTESNYDLYSTDKMIVVVFADEKHAYEGAKALRELHNEGSITLSWPKIAMEKSQSNRQPTKVRSGQQWAWRREV